MTDKPIHVQVAEALLGRTYILSPYVVINGKRRDVPTWLLESDSPDDPPKGIYAGWGPARYDIDWSATGPLMEQYHIEAEWTGAHWVAWTWDFDPEHGHRGAAFEELLLAICSLITALSKAGKLKGE